MSSQPDTVLIAGAGPTGLVAALTLVQNGVPVRIIEKRLNYQSVGQRGAGVAPRTLEAYNLLGVLPAVLSAAGRIPIMWKYDAEGKKPPMPITISPNDEPTPAVPYPNTLVLGQDRAMEILRGKLSDYGVHVELGVDLQSFKQDADSVVAKLSRKSSEGSAPTEETVVVKWLFGADGAKGTVRKQLGVTFLGETLNDEEHHCLTGDIRLTGLDREIWHFWQTEEKMVLLRPSERKDEDLFAFFLRANIDYQKCAIDHEALWKALKTATGREDLVFKGINWVMDWRPNIRMVDTFQKGRVFVGGDAAHVHTPAGGQGMNSSIQDAFNLSWKLALVAKGLAPSSLLDTYTEERAPVIAEMLNLSTALLEKTRMKSGKSADTSGWHRGKELTQLGVNYRWSSIVVDEALAASHGADRKVADAYGTTKDGRIHAGDSARDAPGMLDLATGQTTSFFATFRANVHTVLIFTVSPEDANPIAAMLAGHPPGTVQSVLVFPRGSSETAVQPAVDRVFVDRAGFAWAGYVQGEGTFVVVVRPDGVLGAVAHGADGVAQYFKRIFL
ncbi:hypothetical protein PLICRDRAFT_29823 [Plicaturopsis crispa FD-325 SS-3]|nr:hypothetical protein PLICRDRAFT_29823 [Plicaturopsis crispa FD-325 SS-3]